MRFNSSPSAQDNKSVMYLRNPAPSPGRWQNGAAVLIQAWYRGNIYRIQNYALLVACRRLYERTHWRYVVSKNVKSCRSLLITTFTYHRLYLSLL